MNSHELPRPAQTVLHDLPERERGEFLRQYQAAADATMDDADRDAVLRELLDRWQLVAVAATRPGYYEAVEAAKAGVGQWTPLEKALKAEYARRAS